MTHNLSPTSTTTTSTLAEPQPLHPTHLASPLLPPFPYQVHNLFDQNCTIPSLLTVGALLLHVLLAPVLLLSSLLHNPSTPPCSSVLVAKRGSSSPSKRSWRPLRRGGSENIAVQYFFFILATKGSCHLRISGFCPLRGGGYPPCPLMKKSFFFSH